MSFVEQFKQLNWDDISMSIYAKTAQDVERALNKPKRDLEDFKALISPAAEAYLEQMAQLSYSATRKRFGNTMSLYIPLYLSNLCANACTYCGFSMENRIKRRTLNRDEVAAEVEAIKRMKFDSVLLVTGEHETKVGMKYFREMVPMIKKRFNYLAMASAAARSRRIRRAQDIGFGCGDGLSRNVSSFDLRRAPFAWQQDGFRIPIGYTRSSCKSGY